MRIIALIFSFLSVLSLSLTMVAGLKAGHGQEFFISHLYWGFVSLSLVLVTLALCLMFIFKMHSIMHDLVRKLDRTHPEEGEVTVR
jgi:hypothetical protein